MRCRAVLWGIEHGSSAGGAGVASWCIPVTGGGGIIGAGSMHNRLVVVGAAVEEEARSGGGGRVDVEPAAGERDEVDVVELNDLMSAGEAPVDGGEEGALEGGDLSGSEAAHARLGRVGAESIAMLLRGEGDGRDDQAVHGQG